MIALIDMDIIQYHAGFATEYNEYYLYDKDNMQFDWVAKYRYKKEAIAHMRQCGGEDGFIVKKEKVIEPVENALNCAKLMINSMLKAVEAERYEGFLSGETNFRDGIATIQKYKGNRDNIAKPVHYDAIREYLIQNWDAQIVEGYEADDALGIRQDENTIICSVDKDLDMIPGWHYNFVRKEKYYVDDSQADFNFYMQLLQGDPTDNIKGIPRIGPKKAEKILTEGLNKLITPINVIRAAYADAFPELSDEDIDKMILETGRLLWIWRKPNDLWSIPR